ncbi:MAG TPA: asparagine--tRNA ligase, partial [Leptospiraceae bacterium]|nr:asparagine--tRNA ligase [Leptospiraceae bacterium]
MSEQISFKKISDFEGQEVSAAGWLQGKRGNNHIQFLQVRNSGYIVQAVCEKEKFSEDEFQKIKSLAQESS